MLNTRMKKIILYINSIHRGGAERVMVNLANQLVREGNDCILVTSFRDSWEYPLDPKIRRISLFETPISNYIIRNIRLVMGLRRIVKKEKPDTILSFMAEPNFRSLIACFGIRVKKIISVRNDPEKEYPFLFTKLLAKTLFNTANHVVFQTENAKLWFPKSIQKKSSILLNPVDEIFYLTRYNGVRKDIVTTGRLVPQKNHELLIRAYAKVSEELEDNLYIYGDGPLKGYLSELIHKLNLDDRVFLPGTIKNVAETIKSSRLFVLSSDYEGLPNSLMEAMALGIPCLSTNCPCGGPKDLINEDYLFAKGDELGLASLLSKTKKLSFFDNNYKVDVESFRPCNIYKDWFSVLD